MIAATLPHDPTLEIPRKLFPSLMEGDSDEPTVNSEGIFYPTSDEDFAKMMGMFEQEGFDPAADLPTELSDTSVDSETHDAATSATPT